MGNENGTICGVFFLLITSEMMDFDEAWSDRQDTTYYSKSVFPYRLKKKKKLGS